MDFRLTRILQTINSSVPQAILMLKMMKNNPFAFFLEILWLIIAIILLLLAVKNSIYRGINQSFMLYLLFIVSLTMFWFRRNRRLSQKK
jgi:NADH:ubiquinone oxidoreductase subunit 2 (subunit N)